MMGGKEREIIVIVFNTVNPNMEDKQIQKIKKVLIINDLTRTSV